MLRTTTIKPSRIVFVLVAAAAVLFGGYITALAILAPEQLAEATTAATDLICDKCVGTTDIADGAVTSAKIGGSQVKNTDIGNNAVTSGKIADGQVTTLDIGPDAITAAKIGAGQVDDSELADDAVSSRTIEDFQVGTSEIASNAINTAKILNGQVTGNDIANGAFGVGTEDIAPGAIKLSVHRVQSSVVNVPASQHGSQFVDCPAGTILTGGGFSVSRTALNVYDSFPQDENTWRVNAVNESTGGGSIALAVFALCIDPTEP